MIRAGEQNCGMQPGSNKSSNVLKANRLEFTPNHLNKKWSGVAKEFFTSADKYHVTIVPQYAEDRNKMNIVVTAITIDMVLKESQ